MFDVLGRDIGVEVEAKKADIKLKSMLQVLICWKGSGGGGGGLSYMLFARCAVPACHEPCICRLACTPVCLYNLQGW